MNVFTTLTTNQKLAAAAFLLGAIALFSEPQPGHAVSISPKDLAVIVEQDADQVAAPDLATWILEGRADYRLIDLRDGKAFAEYHIPGAEQIAITALPDQSFAPTERIVLYADGGTQSAQAWFLMKARGARNVYMLSGGLEAWKREVLYPTLAAEASLDQRTQNEERSRIATHFGGQAIVAGASPATSAPAALAAPVPKVEAPVAPVALAGGGKTATPKKRKEGC